MLTIGLKEKDRLLSLPRAIFLASFTAYDRAGRILILPVYTTGARYAAHYSSRTQHRYNQ
jgi:hypothetical protein